MGCGASIKRGNASGQLVSPSSSSLTGTICVRDREFRADRADAKSTLRALRTAGRLTRLQLVHVELGDQGAVAMAAMLPSSLALLCLGAAGVRDDGVAALGAMLPSSLTSLGFAANDIGDDGIVSLARALPGTAITALDLRANSLGNVGAEALAAVLPASAVTILHLGGNDIRDFGAASLGTSLSSGAKLTSLNLFDNEIGLDGARALSDSLQDNQTITSLELRRNNFSYGPLLLEVNSVLERNQACCASIQREPIPTIITNREDICAICLDLVPIGTNVSELKCAHLFHEACLGSWFSVQAERLCPQCRLPTDK